MELTQKNISLLLVLAAGLLLRGLGSTFGSPSLFVSNDEAIFHYSALNVIAEKSLVVNSYYTPLGTYLQLPFLALAFLTMKILGFDGSLAEIELLVLSHEGFFLFVPRLISALFGTLSILVIYKITQLLFNNWRISLLAAFVSATSFSLVHFSHFARPWSTAIFFVLLAFYFVLKSRFSLSFLSTAISYGFLQIGIFSLPLIWFYLKRINIRLIGSFVSLIFLILIFNKLTAYTSISDALLKFKADTFVVDIFLGKFNFPESIVRTFEINSFRYFAKNFLVTEPIIFVFAVFGILKGFGHFTFLHLRLLLFILIYAIFTALFLYPTLHYLLLSMIFLIPFSAYGVYSFLGIFKAIPMRVMLAVVLLILGSLHSIYWNLIFLKKPTFVQTADWIKQNVGNNEPIAYTGGRYQIFVPDKESIVLTSNFNPGFYGRLLDNIESAPKDNTRKIFYVNNFPGTTKQEKLKSLKGFSDIKYAVDYFYDPQDSLYLSSQNEFKVIAEFNPVRDTKVGLLPETLYQASWNFRSASDKIELSMYSLERTGPTFQILEPLF